MKGIILAGGTGSRLRPITSCTSKQLLPIYDKPLIYYPLSTLMLAGIREILIITTKDDQSSFHKLLGDGRQLGMEIEYATQDKPEGIAQAFTIGAEFIGNENVCLILGDNIFHGYGLGRNLISTLKSNGATIYGYEVKHPEQYGVAEIDNEGRVISIEEKPTNPKSRYAIPGIYFFDNKVVGMSKNIQKSARGELEITSLLQKYLEKGELTLNVMERGTAWMDCGTIQGLNDASNYVRAIEERQGNKIAAIEEIAWRNRWISHENLIELVKHLSNNDYSEYLRNLH